MGGLFGGGSQSNVNNQAGTATEGPNANQQPFVGTQWSAAANDYNNAAKQGPYQGQLYTGINGTQTGAANQAAGYASGQGNGLAGQSGGVASQLYGAATPYLSNANGIASGGSSNPAMATLGSYANGSMSAGGASSWLSAALNQSATQGAQTLGNTYGQITNTALGNNTGQTIANASQYANSGYTAQQVAADNAQIDQTLHESTVPGLNQQAAMGGSLDSSRAGMAEAQANEGAAISKGLTDSSLQNNAFNTGVNASTTQLESGLSNANYAAGAQGSQALGTANLQQGLSEYNAGNQLSAANSALGNQLSANGQLGSALSLGNSTALTSGDQATTNYNLGSTAGSLFQNNANNENAANYAQFQNTTNFPWQQLSNYAGLVDAPNTSMSNSTGTGSALTSNSGVGTAGGILGTATGIGGLLAQPSGSYPGAPSYGSQIISTIGSLFGGGGSAAPAVGGLY